MSAGHAHHHHDHPREDFTHAFALGIGLNVAIVLVELVFGAIANSMALMADAGHNLSDVLGLVVGLAGSVMARRSPSPRFTYGLKKASILAALINALFLLVAVGAIGAEAVRRLFHPSSTDGTIVMIVAGIGIVINGGTALLFARGRDHDINIRGAYLHMAADAVVSAAVVVAGLLILWTGSHWIDPAISLAVSAVILWCRFALFRESVGMSLMGVPSGIALEEVEAALAELPGAETVHDLHVWSLSTTETALTAHIVAPDVDSTDGLLERARKMLHDRFAIEHCTIQVERVHLKETRCS